METTPSSPIFAGVSEYLFAVDFKAFAELEISPFDDLFQMSLALDQRQLSKIVAVEIEQVEGDQHDPGRLSLQLVLKD